PGGPVERLEPALKDRLLAIAVERRRVLVHPAVVGDLVPLAGDLLDERGVTVRGVTRDAERARDLVLREEVEQALDADQADIAARDHARVVRAERPDPEAHPVEVEGQAD